MGKIGNKIGKLFLKDDFSFKFIPTFEKNIGKGLELLRGGAKLIIVFFLKKKLKVGKMANIGIFCNFYKDNLTIKYTIFKIIGGQLPLFVT